MRNSRELPALSSSAPVTTRTSRRDTGIAQAPAAPSVHTNRIGQIDVGRCIFTAPPPDEAASRPIIADRRTRRRAGSIGLLVDLALLHDEADVFELADIGERIALHGDDIRRLAGGDGTE